VQHFASFVDLTDHKREQGKFYMLIDELNRRAKAIDFTCAGRRRMVRPLHIPPGKVRLTRGMAHELEDTVDRDYRKEGVVCTVNFPASSGARDG